VASAAEAIVAPIREAAVRAGVPELWRWWTSELLGMLPDTWRERLSSRGVTLVSREGDGWRTLRPVGGQLLETGQIHFGAADMAGRREMFRRLDREAGGGAANVWLVLPDEDVLIRAATLPLAAEESLREAVGFELDRLTPFAEEQACYDHRVTGRDAGANRISIEVAVAMRASVESRLAELRDLGATVLGIGVASDLAGSAAPFNLLAPQSRERPARSRAAMAARYLAALTAVLALVALVYPVWQKREKVIELLPRLEKAKAGAEVADRLAKEIEKLAAEHNFLLSKKQGQYPTVTLLEDLSRLLPDSTWVQQLDIKAGPKMRELQISGETGSSSQLIELLEKSGSLANASFKSPVTKGVTPNTERFLIAAEVKPRPLPDPIPEAVLLANRKTAPQDARGTGAPAPASETSAPAPSTATPTPGAAPAATRTVAPPPAAAGASTPPPAPLKPTYPTLPPGSRPVPQG
jgi:general secretion pathway protein L